MGEKNVTGTFLLLIVVVPRPFTINHFKMEKKKKRSMAIKYPEAVSAGYHLF